MRAINRQILRLTGIFTGVRTLNAVCSLVRNKMMALLVGPVGMGLTILYNSVIDMVSQACRLSIDQSCIRSITADNSATHQGTIATVVSRWCRWLGLAGMAIMLLMSPLLSLWSFDTTDRWWTYAVLSPVPLLTTLTGGRQALLQGLGHMQVLARAIAIGTATATAISLALIWWLRIDAIVPMILLFSVSIYTSTMIISPRLTFAPVSNRSVWHQGAGFIKLGALMTLSIIVAQLFNYLFILYLNHTGHTTTVGIYQSGYVLINTYMGLVLTGVWVEYFPRLGRAVHSRRAISTLVSNQVALIVKLSIPLVLTFIVCDRWIVQLLYADSFMSVVPYISLGVIGVLFRSFSLCLSIVMLARGAGRLFVITESLSSVLSLVLNIAGYELGGMTGLGLAYTLWYALYTAIVWWAYRHRLDYRLKGHPWLLLTAATALAAVTLLIKVMIYR